METLICGDTQILSSDLLQTLDKLMNVDKHIARMTLKRLAQLMLYNMHVEQTKQWQCLFTVLDYWTHMFDFEILISRNKAYTLQCYYYSYLLLEDQIKIAGHIDDS